MRSFVTALRLVAGLFLLAVAATVFARQDSSWPIGAGMMVAAALALPWPGRQITNRALGGKPSAAWALALFAMLFAGPFAATLVDGEQSSDGSVQASSGNGKVRDGAVQAITRAGYPKTYEAWGEDGVQRINALMDDAAQIMASSEGCDNLMVLGLSDRSEPPGSIVFFGDCENKRRFYISESQVKDGISLVSEDKKAEAVSDTDYINVCKMAIREELKFPSSFDPGWFGTSVYRAQAGRVVTTINFEAMNDFGASLDYEARCYSAAGSFESVEFSMR